MKDKEIPGEAAHALTEFTKVFDQAAKLLDPKDVAKIKDMVKNKDEKGLKSFIEHLKNRTPK